jgi:hypothetical protein
MQPQNWQFFFGACFLTGALLLHHAPPVPVFAGMVFAGLARVAWFQIVKDWRRIRSSRQYGTARRDGRARDGTDPDENV